MKLRDYAAVLAVMAIWGLNFPMAKLGIAEIPPLLFMALRFGLVAAILCPFVRLPREKIGAVMVLAVLLGGLHFSLFFSGLARMDAGTASILSQLQVPFAAILALVLYRDRLRPREIVGMAVAFAGTVLIAGQPRFGRDLAPLVMVLTATFVWVIANVQIRRIGSIDGLALSGWLALFCVPQLLLLSALLEHGQVPALRAATWRGWVGITYGGIAVAIVSYGLWYPLIRRHRVNQIMPFNLLVPIFAIASSALILGERPSWQAAVGGLATLIGVAVMVLSRNPPDFRRS